MAEAIQRALREVRDTLLSNPVSPRVETPADINKHYCRWVAETVSERIKDQYDVQLLEDGGRGFAHVWIAYDGRHYDVERIDGVTDHTHLPFFQRHPEAVMRVEPASISQGTIRRRGFEPLYPDM